MPVVFYHARTSLEPYFVAFLVGGAFVFTLVLCVILSIVMEWSRTKARERRGRDDTPQDGVWPPPPNKPPP